MPKKSEIEGQLLANGGATTADQLALMRMLLKQQQAPTFVTTPVQDIGGGIAQGAGNIANAIVHNRTQRADQAQMDAMLAHEQQAQQAAAQQLAQQQYAQDSAGAAQLGVDMTTYQSMSNEMRNSMLKTVTDNAQRNQKADTLMNLFPQAQPMPGQAGFTNLSPQSPYITRDQAMSAIDNPSVYSNLADMATKLQQNQLVAPLIGAYNPNSLAQTNSLLATGLHPMTGPQWAQSNYDASSAGYNMLSNRQEATYKGAGLRAGINSTNAGTLGTLANTQGTQINNQYLPAKLQQGLDQGANTLATGKFELGRKTQAYSRAMDNAKHPERINTPAGYQRESIMSEAGGLGNPYAPGQSTNERMAGVTTGKGANKNAQNFDNYTKKHQTHPMAPSAPVVPIAHPTHQGVAPRLPVVHHAPPAPPVWVPPANLMGQVGYHQGPAPSQVNPHADLRTHLPNAGNMLGDPHELAKLRQYEALWEQGGSMALNGTQQGELLRLRAKYR